MGGLGVGLRGLTWSGLGLGSGSGLGSGLGSGSGLVERADCDEQVRDEGVGLVLEEAAVQVLQDARLVQVPPGRGPGLGSRVRG